jgi:hypothetical protein
VREQKGKLFNSGGLEKGAVTEVYKPKNIYNADYIGLFFRIPHNRTVGLKDNSSQREDNCFVCFVSIQNQWGS